MPLGGDTLYPQVGLSKRESFEEKAPLGRASEMKASP